MQTSIVYLGGARYKKETPLSVFYQRPLIHCHLVTSNANPKFYMYARDSTSFLFTINVL